MYNVSKREMNHIEALINSPIETQVCAIEMLTKNRNVALNEIAKRSNMTLVENTVKTNNQIIINKGKVTAVEVVKEVKVVETKEVEVDNTDYDLIRKLTIKNNGLKKEVEGLTKENKELLERIAKLEQLLEKSETEGNDAVEESESTEVVEDIEPEEGVVKIEYVSHMIDDNNTYHFLYNMTDAEGTVEFMAMAHKNHKLPIVYDADPTDIEFLNIIKEDINNRTGIYNTLKNDYVPEYRYHRSEDMFIYFNEQTGVFKGYYCGNEHYEGRAFVFDINSGNKVPGSRAFRYVIKDYKEDKVNKYTTMNGKGKSITMWRDRIIEACRKLYKQSVNAPMIDKAKVIAQYPWTAADEKEYNQAIAFLRKEAVEFEVRPGSYMEIIDAELRHIVEVRAKGNMAYGRKTVEKFQDRIHDLKLTALYQEEKTETAATKAGDNDDLSNVEL